MAREKGLFKLSERDGNPFGQCVDYLLRCGTDDALDIIEVSFCYLDSVVRSWNPHELYDLRLTRPDDAIAELNGRFKEHRLGYFYANGRIGRIDSEYLHAEAVQPALRLLREQGTNFSGPLEEFLAAHEHHRKGNHKDAIANAHKAFESTLKAICDARGWAYDPQKDAARRLIEIIFDNRLVPDYLQTQFTALRSVLEAGVPTVRNRTSGHGQGATPTHVPDWLAAYALHLTASNIVLLVEAHKAMG